MKIAKEIHAKGTAEEGSELKWVKHVLEEGGECMKFLIGADKEGETLTYEMSYVTPYSSLLVTMNTKSSKPDYAKISYYCESEDGIFDMETSVKPSKYKDSEGFDWKINQMPESSEDVFVDKDLSIMAANLFASVALSVWSDMINDNTSYSGIYDLGWKQFCEGKHNYAKDDIIKVIKKPTTKATGKQKVRCPYCGKVYTATIPKRPTKPTITKVSKGTKAFTVKWKKKSSVTGYQVKYSTSKSMKNAKKVTVAKKSATAKTVKNLKKGKKYYVQVRAYKEHHGVKYYSSWSKKKYVKTK